MAGWSLEDFYVESSVTKYKICCMTHRLRNTENYCSSCVQTLCKECSMIHHHHKLTPVNDISLLNYPPELLRKLNRCTKHADAPEFNNYNHGNPCCEDYFQQVHNNCTNSNLSVNKRLNGILVKYDIMRRRKIHNIEKLNKQKETCLEKIKEILTSFEMCPRLTVLEQKLMQELVFIHNKLILECRRIVQKIDDGSRQVNKLKIRVDEIVWRNRRMDQIEIKICIHELCQQKLIDKNYLSQKELTLKTEKDILSLFNVESVGQIVVTTEQIKDYGVQNINLKGESMFRRLTVGLTELDILPFGFFVFVDETYENIIVQDTSGICYRAIQLPYRNPFGMTLVSYTRAAVTFPSQKKILWINLLTGRVENETNTNGHCCGIELVNKTLIVSVPNSTEGHLICFYDLTGKAVREIQVPVPIYSAELVEDQIYSTSHEDSKVLCFNIKGELEWTFYQDFLEGPSQVKSDKNGLLYVLFDQSCHLVVLSPDGQCYKVVLCKEDGLESPRALHVDKNNNSCVICNFWNQNNLVYKIHQDETDTRRLTCTVL